MRAAEQDAGTCPLLMLAPMESLGDRWFRQAVNETVGGFDEACTEFMRIPNHANHPIPAVKGIVATYHARELKNIPIGAQVMSSNPELLALATDMLITRREAPRVDLNCGCPANTVTGNGAGSSLLRTPEVLHECVKAMVQAAGGAAPVSVKMRSGYLDTSLFEENLLAAQEAGASFITIHPRTKLQTYDGRADWSLIARARQLLKIPVVGNGDVVSVAAARQLVKETGCGAVMVGRGAVTDPLLFHRIRASYEQPDLPWEWDEPEVVVSFLRTYAQPCLTPEGCSASSSATSNAPGEQHSNMSKAGFFGRMKKIMRYLFSSEPELWMACDKLLRAQPDTMSGGELVELLCSEVRKHWRSGGPSQLMLYNHMTKTVQLVRDKNAHSASPEASITAELPQPVVVH